MLLEDYKFGKANAETEFLLTPEIFEKAFFDSRNIADKLLNDYQFMLLGRKGVGKSAFSARIMSIASNSDSLFAEQINLNEFEFSTFAKTSISDEIEGTRKYKASWDFLLLLSIYKLLFNNLKIQEVKELNDVIKFLDSIGFSIKQDLKRNISLLSKIKLGLNIKHIDCSIENELKELPIDYLERLNLITEYMQDALINVYLNQGKLTLLIDGLDDILRFSKDQIEILGSLVRSAEYLNKIFIRKKIPIKIILFIREDIMSMIMDPDFNKIKRDGAITLNWYNRSDDLMDIVKLRVKLSGVNEDKLEDWWFDTFPKQINKKKDSWSFILDHTLGKPRDILQFMITCINLFPHHENLSQTELKVCLKDYSINYFLDEMGNELAGFIDDNIINTLPSVLRRLGGRDFSLSMFKQVQQEQLVIEKSISDEDVKYLLLLLFEAGYIGQLIPTKKYVKGKIRKNTNVIFKYRNTTATIDYNERFIIHKGLFNALDIRQ